MGNGYKWVVALTCDDSNPSKKLPVLMRQQEAESKKLEFIYTAGESDIDDQLQALLDFVGSFHKSNSVADIFSYMLSGVYKLGESGGKAEGKKKDRYKGPHGDLTARLA